MHQLKQQILFLNQAILFYFSKKNKNQKNKKNKTYSRIRSVQPLPPLTHPIIDNAHVQLHIRTCTEQHDRIAAAAAAALLEGLHLNVDARWKIAVQFLHDVEQ